MILKYSVCAFVNWWAMMSSSLKLLWSENRTFPNLITTCDRLPFDPLINAEPPM